MTLNELFKNTNYDDTLFSAEIKAAVETRIFMKSVRGAAVPYITCAIRDKEIKLTPEEAVRQLYIYKLMNEYGYAASRIQLETPIHFGREVKRADIAIMDKDRPMVPYIIVELKKPKLTDGKEQLKSYCNATGAPIGVWTNGEQISCYNRKDPNFFEEISDIPKAMQKLSDIIKWQNKVGRDVLFIERNLNFLKPGGRMAIVLPQGRFNNSSDKYIREFIAERCRILAVVGLHGNVFKPHTGTKTSVLFVQKWDDEMCPKKEDYPIFFAISLIFVGS